MASSSAKSILKSTSLIGGAQVFKILLSIARTKVIALLIGPGGLGMIGAFSSGLGLIQYFASLGVDFAAVREISRTDSQGDAKDIDLTIKTVKLLSIVLGSVGAVIAFLLAEELSQFTFNSNDFVVEFQILSVTVLFSIVSNFLMSIVQGKRHILDYAKVNMYGAFLSTVFSIPAIYLWKMDGIVIHLSLVSLFQVFVSWYYAKKIFYEGYKFDLKRIFTKAKSFLKLGTVFMLSGATSLATEYLIRVIIIRELDIQASGLYQAAMTLSSLYVTIILDAMGKDFFPRLSASLGDHSVSNKLINEQIEVGILLAIPGLSLTLLLAPIFIKVFYSSEFSLAQEILRWQVLGIFLKVMTYPFGYLLLSLGREGLYFVTESTRSTLGLVVSYFSLKLYGIIGVGMAFSLTLLFHFVLMIYIARKETKFHWNKGNLLLIISNTSVLIISCWLLFVFEGVITYIFISLMVLVITMYSVIRITRILNLKSFKTLLNYLNPSPRR